MKLAVYRCSIESAAGSSGNVFASNIGGGLCIVIGEELDIESGLYQGAVGRIKYFSPPDIKFEVIDTFAVESQCYWLKTGLAKAARWMSS